MSPEECQHCVLAVGRRGLLCQQHLYKGGCRPTSSFPPTYYQSITTLCLGAELRFLNAGRTSSSPFSINIEDTYIFIYTIKVYIYSITFSEDHVGSNFLSVLGGREGRGGSPLSINISYCRYTVNSIQQQFKILTTMLPISVVFGPLAASWWRSGR